MTYTLDCQHGAATEAKYQLHHQNQPVSLPSCIALQHEKGIARPIGPPTMEHSKSSKLQRLDIGLVEERPMCLSFAMCRHCKAGQLNVLACRAGTTWDRRSNSIAKLQRTNQMYSFDIASAQLWFASWISTVNMWCTFVGAIWSLHLLRCLHAAFTT